MRKEEKNKMKKLSVLIVLGILLVGVTTVWAEVIVVPYDNMEHIDAAHICVRSLEPAFDFGIKIEAWGGPQSFDDDIDKGPGTYDDHDYDYDPEYANTINYYPAAAPDSRIAFDWDAENYAIGAVVVQGGPMDNVYFYNPAEWDGYGEVYDDPDSNKQEKISHVTFCWNREGANGEEECYQEETAWADGDDYIDADQWAMYVPYFGEALTVDIYAGQNMLAGTATFSDPVDGEVTITIVLNPDWIFYYDLDADDEEYENLKVQDYESPPEGNPAIGHFDWKLSVPVGSTTATIVVPENNYYGVHLDVAQKVDCETAE